MASHGTRHHNANAFLNISHAFSVTIPQLRRAARAPPACVAPWQTLRMGRGLSSPEQCGENERSAFRPNAPSVEAARVADRKQRALVGSRLPRPYSCFPFHLLTPSGLCVAHIPERGPCNYNGRCGRARPCWRRGLRSWSLRLEGWLFQRMHASVETDVGGGSVERAKCHEARDVYGSSRGMYSVFLGDGCPRPFGGTGTSDGAVTAFLGGVEAVVGGSAISGSPATSSKASSSTVWLS